ncbi:transketolase [bacterium]|nr:transketolase [bacterium]
MKTRTTEPAALTLEELRQTVLNDYRLACESREASLLGRREVLTGKAKFGIFGDGKELAQLAWAKVFRPGDFRSGYYRDQTVMFATGALTLEGFFASLYADTDPEREPASGGRQMNGHFTTHTLDENGEWLDLTAQVNSSADISPTAGQMPRLLGLAQASKMYRELGAFPGSERFSQNGSEIAWGTIGNASTSEGLFFEVFNAAGVLQVPLVISVWDDDYGISVHSRHQTTKENISEILKGFQRDSQKAGFEIITVKGWDYAGLVEAYAKAEQIARHEHVPVLVHVREMTQPQGHSTSGSHERYKNEQRLKWETDFDCIKKFGEYIVSHGLAEAETLEAVAQEARQRVKEAKDQAWKAYLAPIAAERDAVVGWIEALGRTDDGLLSALKALKANKEPLRREMHSLVRRVLLTQTGAAHPALDALRNWRTSEAEVNRDRYSSFLHSQSAHSALRMAEVAPTYAEDSPVVDARVVLRDNFDRLLQTRPEVLIFGEDSGKIGDVNQGLEGLQAKHGEARVSDTGIREASILGQGIGMSMRGLRPIAEIQYLDYLLYALQIMSDDLATVQYRSRGRQKAPVVVRTRGHRLEGIWHSGSPMGGILHLLRGVYILVPRNMTKAAGFYNTLLDSDEPGLIVECLNGYRLKERMPANLAEIRTPVGQVEILQTGADITVLTYGSNCRIAQEAAEFLGAHGIDIELIDAQCLWPFDLDGATARSLQKTNRLVVFDEDVPGGASAYLLQQVLEEQGGYRWLDSPPRTLTAQAHRPAYGSDGDYFSKPSAEDLIELCINLMHEADPGRFPLRA